MKNKITLSRRTFIKSGIVLTAGIPFMQSCGYLDGKKNASSASGDLYTLFQTPPDTSKPFVRWWWNGDKLSEKEILRELDVMKEAGIGGVEINPIAFPGGDDLGIPSLRWLSPEWIEMVKTALKGAEERSITCDIIVGSGWPFGAEYLEREEQSQLLTIASREVKGKGRVSLEVAELLKDAAPTIHSGYSGATSELYSLWLAPIQMDTFAPALPVPFTPGDSHVTADVPEGEYILYALVKVTGFQAVINGAPGAAGPVLNHYNQTAVEKFLNNMSDHLFPALTDLKGFRAMFCDSMELEGANWCHDFPDEFKNRRGYDIVPYLPFILYKIGHMGRAIEGAKITKVSGAAKEEIERVRHDFFVTCMEIISDRFLTPFTQWCNKHGFKSRVQAYGREFHPLEASLKVDIPECETWLWHGESDLEHNFAKNPAYTNVNKFVASAVHLSGKKEVSCEEITNTSVVFNATLEQIKVVGDQSNLSGVTHSILHGFNYSPPETPFPGWVRYGTYFNERNTWWPFFKLWAAYKARISAILQETEAFADIAVMHPLADMWTKFGPVRDPFPELLYPEYQYRVWEAIHQNGNSCDYTSENIIQQSVSKNGFLTYNSRKYHTLILLEVETVMPATAEALMRFVKSGGKLVFTGKEPYKSPGLKNHRENDEKVKQTIAAIKRDYPSQVFTVESPGEPLSWFKNVQQQCGIKPYMEIDRPSPYVSQIRHRTESEDIYFIVNYSTSERLGIRARFPDSRGKAWIWDAETGSRSVCPTEQGNTLTVDLPPATSRIIVFDSHADDGAPLSVPEEKQGIELLTGWNMHMLHINGNEESRNCPALFDLSEDESTRAFAGHLIYEKQFETEPGYNWLDLGKVHGVSEVTLNGEALGCKWYGRHLYRIPEHLAAARSKMLQVRITTTVGNYLKSSPGNETGQRWTRHQKWQPAGMLGPVRLL
ncbi:MAG: hypothetical protein LBS42_03555 [Tannerella sp.]|jgi:hypothetical protein|nr:hypothetical protein [Tannerella sp.]